MCGADQTLIHFDSQYLVQEEGELHMPSNIYKRGGGPQGLGG